MAAVPGSRLQGKVAIVTGSSATTIIPILIPILILTRTAGGGSGFGAAISQRYAQEGAKVVVADINVEGGQNVASKDPANLVFQKTDVTNVDDWKAVVDLAFSKFGRLDVLVNNAGTTYRNKVGWCQDIQAANTDLNSPRWKSQKPNGSECSPSTSRASSTAPACSCLG